MAEKSVDQQLREFLAREDQARREGKTIEALHEKQDRMMIALRRSVRDRLEDKATMARHGAAIKTLQHQVGLISDAVPQVPAWRPPKEETQTGSHAIAAIAAAKAAAIEERLDEEEERKLEEETWWRRQRWLWFGISVAAVFSVTAAGCVGYVSYRIQTLEKGLETRPAK